MPEHQNFRPWFVTQLRRREWSPAEFIRQSGIPRGTVYSWNRGTRTPGPEHADAIAEAFGLRRNDVLAILGIADPDIDVDPRSHRARVIGLVDRIDWENDRYAANLAVTMLEQILDSQKQQRGSGSAGAKEHLVPIKP